MMHLPASVRVYLCATACDMRRSFDGLHALVRDYLQLDAFAGHLFVFVNRRRDQVKILYWTAMASPCGPNASKPVLTPCPSANPVFRRAGKSPHPS